MRPYAAAEREGRPINFGFSSSWALARLSVVAGIDHSVDDGRTPIEFFEEGQASARWNAPATEEELSRILRGVERGLDEGGIGVGVLLGYAPDTDPEEFVRVASLAADRRVPVFAHSRTISMLEPGSSREGIREIVDVAESTGAHVHICHLNSTSLRQIEGIRTELLAARLRGVGLSTETYPYGAGSTGLGAEFFAPDRFDRLGTPTTAIRYPRDRRADREPRPARGAQEPRPPGGSASSNTSIRLARRISSCSCNQSPCRTA